MKALLYIFFINLVLLITFLKISKSEIIEEDLRKDVIHILESSNILKNNIDKILKAAETSDPASVISDFLNSDSTVIQMQVCKSNTQ